MIEMRLFASVIASVALLFAASTASALVTFHVTGTSGGDPNALQLGDQITVDIRLSSDGTAIVALAAAVEFDDSVLSYVSGQAVSGYLYEGCVEGVGCFNGFDNIEAPNLDLTSPGQVQIANSASISAPTGTGAQDPGLDGVIGGGDAMFRLTFAALAATPLTTLSIGTNGAIGNEVVLYDGTVEQAINASQDITIVPEPGTALLMGLGLAGLVFAGRRE